MTYNYLLTFLEWPFTTHHERECLEIEEVLPHHRMRFFNVSRRLRSKVDMYLWTQTNSLALNSHEPFGGVK